MRTISTDRVCRFESLESRQLLAADLAFGTIAQSEPIELIQATPDQATSGEASGSLGGRVYLSTELNCSQHENALGLAGVTVFLLNETGTVVGETLTDAEGEYQFSNLLPGTYAVKEVQPADYFEGNARIGSGSGQRFNGSLLGEITVGVGDILVDYDFCEYETDLQNDINAGLGRRIEPHGPTPAEAIRTNVFLELPQIPGPLGGESVFFVPATFIATAATSRQLAITLPPLAPLINSAGTRGDLRQLSSPQVEQQTEWLDRDSPFSTGPFSAGDVRWILSSSDRQVPAKHYEEASVSSATELTADEMVSANESDWLSDLAPNDPWNPDELWMHLGEKDDLAATSEAGAKPFLWLTAELL